MEQRLSVLTLGVADLGRARSFYEGLGWTTRAEANPPQNLLRPGSGRGFFASIPASDDHRKRVVYRICLRPIVVRG